MENTKRLMAAIDQAAEAIVIVDPDIRVLYANPIFWTQTGTNALESIGRPLDEFAWNPADPQSFLEMLAHVRVGKKWSGRLSSTLPDGSLIHESITTTPVVTNGKITCYIQVRRNTTDQVLMEQQLRHAQKLESIGQLSAGIAHELNTPSQFVRDNIIFLKDAYEQVLTLIETIRTAAPGTESAAFQSAAKTADLDYLREEIPRAIEQSIDGMGRITTIVRAMKEFSHQGREKTPSDLNHAIESTITVATNEWKYVADVTFDLDPSLPHVPCVLDEFNQVILNVVVNAAHAIADVVEHKKGEKGTISVSTRQIDNFVEVRIADTGTGMPAEVKARIFEPFFTTKEVGRGTGQGLSIAYAIVVEKHGGSLDVETSVGKGSCFVIRLPLGSSDDQTSVAA
jgi:PAS domain S-box-containing protein